MRNNIKILISIVFILIIELIHAQTKFDIGYSSGYSSGYCQDKPNCIAPISPIPPIPSTNESPDSYKDGYNRGFKDGLNNQENNNVQTNRERYKTTQPKFHDYQGSTNNTNQLLSLLAKKKKEKENKINQDFQAAYTDIKNYEDDNSDYIKNLKITYLNKIEDLANNSAEILTKTDGNYKYLINLLQSIYDEFYDKVEKK